jgi:ABC-type antimicrobial peptide transport system permease subunit
MGKPDSQAKWTTIVGVVGNVKHEKINSEGGIDSYVSFLQVPDANAYLLIRAHVDPMSLAQAVTTQVQSLDPDQSTFDVKIMEDRVASTIWQQRVSGTLFGIFAILAIALAGIGVYGVISYSVSQRTREIGIRMALGAESSRVLKMILSEALILFSAGAFIGLLCALALTRVMRGLLYEVSPFDPLTFAVAPVLLGIVAVAAATIPGLRASRIDPIKALGQE